MQSQEKKQLKKSSLLSLSFKYGAILLLLSLSVLVVACGANGNGAAASNLNGPVVTTTIHLGDQNNLTPTPALAPYYCGAWVTNTTPAMGTPIVVVNAKFVHNVDGNPEGIEGATAQATVLWADGIYDQQPAAVVTTRDGLAIFSVSVPARPSLVNRLTLVKVDFSKAGIPTCTVDTNRAAFFTLIMASPTATATPSPQAANDTPVATATPPKRKN